MLQLTKPADGIQLLRWNKKLPSASAQDPLGLNLRVSARIAAQLLYCITSITPRARYYAFFPWAYQDYADREHGRSGDRGRVVGVLAREKAMVLGAVLHHDGAPCAGGALGGSDAAATLAGGKRKSYGPVSWKHLKNREGQFGAAYKASLINLGLFEDSEEVSEEASEESKELDEAVQAIELTKLSARGKRLADAYFRAIRSTRYVKEQWALRPTVPADVLKEFGKRAGLCEIALKGADDRQVIKEILFACDRTTIQSTHYRRRMTLLLILEHISKSAKAGAFFGRWAASDLTYYGRVVKDEEQQKSVAIAVSPPLRDIAERWRVFHFHAYLTVALQAYLVAIVGVLRHHPGGIDRSRLLDEFQNSAIRARFRKIFNMALPRDFLTLTPAELMAVAGVSVRDAFAGRSSALAGVSLHSAFGERNLARLLEEGEAAQIGGIVLASMLLFTVLLRYQKTVDVTFGGWGEKFVQDPYADVSVPGVLGTLRSAYGDGWWDHPNSEILNLLIWRFVLLQHQTMGYERGFGGGAALFQIDGTTLIGTDADFSNPGAENSRYPSAVRILDDLGLITEDEDTGYRPTEGGEHWLRDQLKIEAER